MTAALNRHLLILILLTFCLPLTAQDDDEPVNSQRRRVSTIGSAEVRVVPSRVVLTFGVETFHPELAAAKRDNDARTAAVIALAKELGIAPKDVQTDYIFVEPVYDQAYGSKGVGKFVHFLVRKTIVVLLRDVTKFENLLSAVWSADQRMCCVSGSKSTI